MKRRYPASSTTSSRAAADGRVRSCPCSLLVTAAPYSAAEAMLRLPGRGRRRDPPGVRPHSEDWRVPPTGYLQEATPGTGGPDGAAGGAPGCAPRRCPRRGSPRSRPGLAHRDRGGRADEPTAMASQPGCRFAWPGRTPRPAASGRRQEASELTAGRWRSRRSDTDPRTALAPPRGEDSTPGPGAHAQPETMRLGTAAVVRLERTLAHWGLQVRVLRSRPPRPVQQHAELAPGVAGPQNATRPGDCRSNQRREPGWSRAGLCLVTAGDTCCLPNERRTRALGCGQRSRARGIRGSDDRRLPASAATVSGHRANTQRAQPVEKPVDQMWGREVNGQ